MIPEKQPTCFNLSVLLCATCLGVNSTGCQLVVLWLYFHIKARLLRPHVILQLDCYPASTMSRFMEEFGKFVCHHKADDFFHQY